MAFRFVMRHESSLIKSLCCKAWRRSMTGVFCVPGFVEADWAGASIGLRDHCPLPFVRGFGFLANWLEWGPETHPASFGYIEKRLPFFSRLPLSWTQEKGEAVHLGCGRRFVAEGAWRECAAYVWRFYSSMLLEEPSISSILAMPSFREKNVRRGSPQSS